MRVQKTIPLHEYESVIAELDALDADLLNSKFNKKLSVDKYSDNQYKITATQFVGVISLHNHFIIIRPKLDNLNFSYVFSYALHDESLFEQITRNFLSRVEELCRRGISKSYYDVEENLPSVRGKILVTKNIVQNRMLQHRVYCNYSDFGPDNLENRIIKYTLHCLAGTRFEDPKLNRRIKVLLHYFEPVSILTSLYYTLPGISYSRLTKHYEPIINLCKLILTSSSLNLQSSGDVKFSSFLIDMNLLFEKFIIAVLKSVFGPKLTVKTGKRITSYSDEERKTRMKPDIIIKKGRKPLLIIDIKYKNDINDSDLNQLWIYSLA
jgi:5-methylcytosine-specific restriction enzyme subunit McrC